MFSKYTVALAVTVIVVHILSTKAQKSIKTDVAGPESSADAAATANDQKSVNPGGQGDKNGPNGKQGRKRGVRRRVRVKNGKRQIVRVRPKKTNTPSESQAPEQQIVKQQAADFTEVTRSQDLTTDAPARQQQIVKNTNKPKENTVPSKKETAGVKVAPKKVRKEKKAENVVQDEFFGLFDTGTTTVGPDPGAPPPEFDPNGPPRKKVMPRVDSENSVAYDGTRKCLL